MKMKGLGSMFSLLGKKRFQGIDNGAVRLSSELTDDGRRNAKSRSN